MVQTRKTMSQLKSLLTALVYEFLRKKTTNKGTVSYTFLLFMNTDAELRISVSHGPDTLDF